LSCVSSVCQNSFGSVPSCPQKSHITVYCSALAGTHCTFALGKCSTNLLGGLEPKTQQLLVLTIPTIWNVDSVENMNLPT
jgi:hypothetical protein